jgi:hypothetical protein
MNDSGFPLKAVGAGLKPAPTAAFILRNGIIHLFMNTVELDRAVEIPQRNKNRWANLSVLEKERLVSQLIEGVLSIADRQVAKSLEAKGISPDSPQSAEEWIAGPLIVIRNLRLLRESLRRIARYRVPRIRPEMVRTRPDGQVVVEVFPYDTFDKILYRGFRAEVWMQPDVRLNRLSETMASFYKQSQPEGRVCLILGAGNVSSIAPLDVIYKLFVEGKVCLLKLSPVNDYIGVFIEEAFAPLIKDGYLQLVYGGADVGAYLCEHTGVDEIHITGSAETHDAIVFGTGEERTERKLHKQPRLTKRITSELGNVSPVIVVPGNWSRGDLKFHSENVATQMTNNAGFNCNAAKVLITHADWTQRNSFLDTLRNTLRSIPTRRAYYPGAFDRYRRFVEPHPQSESFGSRTEGNLPWTLIPGINPQCRDDVCFTQEAFCGIMAETSLPANNAAEFLRQAVHFCNTTLWGTLNACIIVHPKMAAKLGPVLDEAVSDLHYGSVAINHWPALSYGFGVTTWGAYPGHTLDDIQSGVGVVHNTLMFDEPQKSVIYGPFYIWPKPAWFATHRSAHKLAPILTRFEAHPRWSLISQLMWYALLG